MRSATSERTHSHGFAENAGTSTIVVMFIDETIPAAPASTQPPAPAPAATHPAAANAATLPESTHALGPNHAGHAAAPPAAGAAPNAVDAARGGRGGRRHTPMLFLVI